MATAPKISPYSKNRLREIERIPEVMEVIAKYYKNDFYKMGEIAYFVNIINKELAPKNIKITRAEYVNMMNHFQEDPDYYQQAVERAIIIGSAFEV